MLNPGQAVADAYYVLSDGARRKEYDILYTTRGPSERTEQPNASANFFSTFANMFGAGGAGAQTNAGPTPGDRPDAEHVFADVFEEVCSVHILQAECMILIHGGNSYFAPRSTDISRGGRGSVPSAEPAWALSSPTSLALWLARMRGTAWVQSGTRRGRASLRCSASLEAVRKRMYVAYPFLVRAMTDGTLEYRFCVR